MFRVEQLLEKNKIHTTTLIFATLLAFTLSAVMLFRTLVSGKPRVLPVCLFIPKYGSESSKLLPLDKLFIGGASYREGTGIYSQQSKIAKREKNTKKKS